MVVVSLMLESPTMTCRRRYFSASACGSSRVLMIGRLRVVALETPSQMCSARCETAYDAPRGVWVILPAPDDDLPGHQERDQHVGQPAELPGRLTQVVLVAAVGVARRVGVVLEEVDLAGDALVVQPLLGVESSPSRTRSPALSWVTSSTMSSHSGVAYSGGCRRRGRAGAVAQEDVAAAPPADHLAEQVAGDLVRAQPALAP
jgi:hypothetical protein